MKVENMGKVWNRISLTGWKWSSLNAPGSGSPAFHSFLCDSLFLFPLSGVIRNWTSQHEWLQREIFSVQNQLNELKMVHFECPRLRIPCLSFIFVWFLFLISPLWGNKELDLLAWMVTRWTLFGTKSAEHAANGPVWMPQAQDLLCVGLFLVFWFHEICPIRTAFCAAAHRWTQLT